MSELAKQKRVPRKAGSASSRDRQAAMHKKQSPPVKDQQNDSEDIERAVYDGMRDLRADKSK